ncbi:MAG TPA: hypothetical protein PKC21_09800 [Oligoflexia bacterium]|nr:hypothetical protein [Oligoflexia bacterium]HMR25632.1 hypothetical protein [Oligoflexia bacterium]
MKHIILTSILLFSTAVFAQRDLDHRKPWQRLDGGVEQQNPNNNTNTQPIVGPQTDPDHLHRRGYFGYENYTYQNTQSNRPQIYTYSTGQIKICLYGGNFMRIKTPKTEQVFNFTLYNSQTVIVSNTQIKLTVTNDGSWEPVDEKQAYLFEEIECE